MALAWLETPAYVESEHRAYASTIERELYDLRPYGDRPADRVRQTLAQWSHKLVSTDVDRLTRACDAFDAFAAILREGR